MKSLVVILVVVGCLATGEALKCYECANPPDVGCNSPFDKNAAGVKVSDYPPGCECAKVVTEKNSKNETTRGCHINFGSIPSIIDGVIDSPKFEPAPKTYFCNTDLCNGSSSITAALSTSITLAMLLIIKSFN